MDKLIDGAPTHKIYKISVFKRFSLYDSELASYLDYYLAVVAVYVAIVIHLKATV